MERRMKEEGKDGRRSRKRGVMYEEEGVEGSGGEGEVEERKIRSWGEEEREGKEGGERDRVQE